MLALDAAGTVIEANRAALRLLGATRAQVLAHRSRSCSAPRPRRRSRPRGTGRRRRSNLAAEDRRPALDVVLARASKGSATPPSASTSATRARTARGRGGDEPACRSLRVPARAVARAWPGTFTSQTALERAATFCAARPEVGGVIDVPRRGGRLAPPRGRARRERARPRSAMAHVTAKDLEKMLDSPAADVRRAHGVVEAVGAAIDPETTGLVPRWKILVPLAHARRPLGAMLVLGRPGAALLTESRARALGERRRDDLGRAARRRRLRARRRARGGEAAARRQPAASSSRASIRRTGATLFVNGAIERVLGFSAVEVQGQPGMDGLLRRPDRVGGQRRRPRSGRARPRVERGKTAATSHKDGRVLTLRESVYPVRDPSASVRAIQVIAYDVSTEIESRKQLMQADRLASLGALAGGIAHEINNPVAFIGLAAGQFAKLLEPVATRCDPAERERAKQLDPGGGRGRRAHREHRRGAEALHAHPGRGPRHARRREPDGADGGDADERGAPAARAPRGEPRASCRSCPGSTRASGRRS